MKSTNGAFIFISDRWFICLITSLLCIFLLVRVQNRDQHGLSIFEDISLGVVTTTANPKDSNISLLSSTAGDGGHLHNLSSNYTLTAKPKPTTRDRGKKACNIFDGRWVYDPEQLPLYRRCPFLSQQVSCRENGRPEFEYEKWRWEANDCKIPRFNGKDMLQRLRGKRLILVGDSLNRNQFESLACLLYSVIPHKTAYLNFRNERHKIFTAKDYNFSVEFHWSPFLVDLDDSDPLSARILKLSTLHPSSEKWRGADIMIFNTGHWWLHTGKFQTWDLFEYEGKYIEKLDLETAFMTGIKAWARWIDQNVDHAKTTVFLRSISPEHKGINSSHLKKYWLSYYLPILKLFPCRRQWCYNATQPFQDESYSPIFPKPIVEIMENTLSEMKTRVRYLNITKLSQYRRDAHPSVYTAKQGKILTLEQRDHPKSFADCSHWCIPGVPDTWNKLLYASILLDTP